MAYFEPLIKVILFVWYPTKYIFIGGLKALWKRKGRWNWGVDNSLTILTSPSRGKIGHSWAYLKILSFSHI